MRFSHNSDRAGLVLCLDAFVCLGAVSQVTLDAGAGFFFTRVHVVSVVFVVFVCVW